MMSGFITVNRRYKAVEFGTMFDKSSFTLSWFHVNLFVYLPSVQTLERFVECC